MKTLFRTLLALLYLVSATCAQAGFLLNSYIISGAGGASISFVGCTGDNSDLTTYSYVAHATGTAGARKTIVAAGGQDSATDFSIASMTVGGAAATERVDSANAGSLVQSAVYIIDNPSGTTATIDVTFSEAVINAAICVWAAYNLTAETAVDTAAQFQTASAPITLDLDVPPGGVGVGFSYADGNSLTITWTGLTERSEASVSDGGNSSGYSGADTAAPGVPTGVTADWVSTDDSIGVSASFQ